MKAITSAGIGLALALGACAPDSDDDLRPPGVAAIDLSAPAVDQVTEFVRVSLAAGDTTARAYADTLRLRVVAVDGDAIEVEESLSAGSASHRGRPAVAYPDRAFSFTLRARPEGLHVSPPAGQPLQSRLFPQVDELAHVLGSGVQVVGETRLAGLRPLVPYLPRDRTYRLSAQAAGAVAVLAHGARAQGLPGFTFVHEPRRGLRFILVEHDLAGNASGWCRVDAVD